MIELVRQWLIGITCAAMIVAVADGLTPAGTVRKIGRMVGGLVLLVAVVKPVIGVDFSVLAASNIHLEMEMDAAEESNLDLMKTIIGEKTGAYILDKAEALGISCEQVSVECTVGEGDVPFPSAVTVTALLQEDQRRTLARWIEADLAIPEECQIYESGGGIP